MDAPSRYQEHPPPPRLSPFVACLWTRVVAPDVAPPPHRVLPDGCVDIIVAARRGGAPTVAAIGTMTRPVAVRTAAGDSFVGVRFRPGAALPFLGVPADALTDAHAPLDLLRADTGSLSDAFMAAGEAHPDRRAAAVAEALRPLGGATAPPPRVVGAALSMIAAARGRLPVEVLCASLGVTRQHLARQFARHVGIAPKTFCRVTRVREVLRRAAGRRHADWDRLAVEAGYCDQAHLIGDFGELVGETPARWLAKSQEPLLTEVPNLQDGSWPAP
jgi:methylphosphotriester-DNA--protein-cysteine methyltransferase